MQSIMRRVGSALQRSNVMSLSTLSVPSGFKGKTAVITGAGNGIGLATALPLIRGGCKVIAVDRVESAITKLATSCADASLVTPVVVDLADWNQTNKVLGAAIAKGPVHYLVNSAFLRRMETFGELTEKSLDQQFAVGIKGTINVSQMVAERMKATGTGGSILNVSSVASLVVLDGGVVYSSLKAALDHLTHVMAVTLAPYKIRVNTINPGKVDSAFGGLTEEYTKNFLKKVPLARLISKQTGFCLYL
jgi:NAD(P)-dependent dehydrogenase (short-subunit alcohol dehydrogenase family)